MIDPLLIESLLKFSSLAIQHKHWPVAVERTVLASARAFHCVSEASWRQNGLIRLQGTGCQQRHRRGSGDQAEARQA